MADSDEEHERGRSRDKFRRERYDYGGDKGRSRGDYREKRAWRDDSDTGGRRRGRDEYDDEGGKRRYSSGGGYSRGDRDWSPPAKRMRREHWGYPDFPGMMAPYGMRPAPWPMAHDMTSTPHHQIPPAPGMSGDSPVMGGMGTHGSSKHVMLTFKQFLAQEDDSIDEDDAIARYNEYKADFKRKQIEEFFEKHKEEDWFISKYHPKQVKETEESSAASLKSRVAAFLSLLESGRLDEVPISYENNDQVIRFMDAAVIFMEGGTEHDLLSLDQKQSSAEDEEGEGKKKGNDGGDTKKSNDKDKPSFMMTEPSEEEKQLAKQAKQYAKQQDDETEGEKKAKKKKKKKKGDDYSYRERDEASSSSDEEEEAGEEEMKQLGEEDAEEPPPPGMETDSIAPVAGSRSGEKEQSGGVKGAVHAANSSMNGDSSKPSQPLHLTRSVYIRHIPPKVTAKEIIEVCRTIPGYLRIAFADPTPDKGYQRRGWVTYTNDSDIRDVIARLSTSKFGEGQLNCMVNRDLTRRVKQTAQAASTRKGFHNDMQLAIKLVTFLDEKCRLWEHTVEEPESLQQNPVLEFSQSVLSEEEGPVSMATGGGGEEEEGVVNDPGTEPVDNNSEKAKVMDRLLWYLRIVHSLDYYNTMVFPSEDSMPHRCGIFTVRPRKTGTVTIEEVSEYIEGMESKVKPLLEKKKFLSDADMEKYGKKDTETEVERFIEVNTQKLSENKYLCPLSGKKFKGPEFVKKHIFNKHVDKVEAVRQETEFFNNYLRDVDRPMPLEATLNTSANPSNPKTPGAEDYPAGTPPGMGGRGGWNQRDQMMMFGRGGFTPGMGGFPPGMMNRGGFRPPRGGRRGRGRRTMVDYRDLDAPEEMY